MFRKLRFFLDFPGSPESGDKEGGRDGNGIFPETDLLTFFGIYRTVGQGGPVGGANGTCVDCVIVVEEKLAHKTRPGAVRGKIFLVVGFELALLPPAEYLYVGGSQLIYTR